jgi:hypothetical protein
MPYESLDGYAYVDPENEGLLHELFFTEEIKAALARLDTEARAAAERDYLQAIREALKQLEQHPANAGDGGIEPGELHVKVPGTERYFFSIKQALLSLTVSVVPAAAVTLLVPPLVVLKLVPSVVSAGKAVWDAAAALKSETDLDVYVAVVAALERNKLRTLGGAGATLDDIKESFRRQAKDPPGNLTDKLTDLCKRAVLKKDTSSTVTEYYKGF